MRVQGWISIVVAGLLTFAGAGAQGASDEKARAALAPTGKLRVAFFSAPVFP
jgi:hypothetical protein